MTRRIVRFIRWMVRAAPPCAFVAWSLRVYRRLQEAAIPAFGPPEPLVASWRAEMLQELGLGVFLLALSVAAWAWPARGAGSSKKRERDLG